jgi:hypothetical protein
MGIKLIKKKRAASEVLEDAVNQYQTDMVTVGELMFALHERGFGLLLLLFALPNCIPAPGITGLTAIPLLFFSYQLIVGHTSPWLPKWIERKRIRRTLIAAVIQRAAPRMKKLEKLMRPRLSIASSETGERVIGFFCFACALSIALPIPGGNLVPAIAIIIMALGLLSHDGLIILFGILTSIFGIAITTAIVLLGQKVVLALFGLV